MASGGWAVIVIGFVVIVVIVVVLIAFLGFNISSNSIIVNKVNLQINYANVGEQCFGNSIQSLSGFTGQKGSVYYYQMHLQDSCSGSHSINQIYTNTAGFKITTTNHQLPVSFNQGDRLTFNLSIQVPQNYNGSILDIFVNAT